jgi:hypothetical protein
MNRIGRGRGQEWLRIVSLGIATALGLALAPAEVLADYQITAGLDAGVGPGAAHPNYDAALASFLATGPAFSTITFENAPLGRFNDPNHPPGPANATIDLGQGVQAQLTKVDPKPPVPPPPDTTPYVFGVTTDHPNQFDGYNVTPGGAKFLRFVPEFGQTISSAGFTFTTSVTAFGMAITGMGGSITGDVHLTFTTGGVRQDIDLTAAAKQNVWWSPTGGLLFFGITGLPTPINQFAIEERNVPANQRDIIGIDDLRFAAAIPEPAAVATLSIGLIVLSAYYALARRRARLSGR